MSWRKMEKACDESRCMVCGVLPMPANTAVFDADLRLLYGGERGERVRAGRSKRGRLRSRTEVLRELGLK